MKFRKTDRKSGFTLVELLVVLSMLMLLAAAITSSVASGERRAKIAKATAEAQELTNAILAYSHFGSDYKMPENLKKWTVADKGSLDFIIGEKTVNGEKIVLYNASFRGNVMQDPWGRPYEVIVKESKPVEDQTPSGLNNLSSFVAFPNFNRRPADK